MHTFTFNMLKPVGEKVKKVSVALFMKYSTDAFQNAYGIAYAQGNGYDMADLAVVGTLDIAAGQNLLVDPPTSNCTCRII